MDKWITLRFASSYPLIHSPCYYDVAASWFPFRLSNGSLFDCQSACQWQKTVPFSTVKWFPFHLTNTLAGVHVHVYVAGGLPGTERPDDGRWLAQSQANFRAYLEVMRRWNVPPRVVVSECCLLGKYPEGVYLKVQEAYMRWLRNEPAVESIAWFSARYAGFPDADLLRWGGGLRVIGQNWLDWRWN